MKLVSIEPTPSPNSMKLNLDEELPVGETRNFNKGDDLSKAPDYIQKLFSINGVKNIYHVADFIALERNPKVAWEVILPEARSVFGEENNGNAGTEQNKPLEHFGDVKVYIQMYRNIPMQVKLDDGHEEKRFGLPAMFQNAVMKATEDSPNFVMERKWVEQSIRYGSMDEIGQDVVEELIASYDQERLNHLVEKALQPTNESITDQAVKPKKVTLEVLDNPDWKVRYAALDRMDDPTLEDLPLLAKALDDEKMSIRRLATAYLGMIEEKEVLPYLYKALKDKVVTVRRTAGDCLSDLGFKEAMPEMIASLKDPSKIVRWRAAMFLYEIGDESALPALKEAADDPEFEVKMQIKMAIERIEGGEEGKGSVWYQMTQATKKE